MLHRKYDSTSSSHFNSRIATGCTCQKVKDFLCDQNLKKNVALDSPNLSSLLFLCMCESRPSGRALDRIPPRPDSRSVRHELRPGFVAQCPKQACGWVFSLQYHTVVFLVVCQLPFCDISVYLVLFTVPHITLQHPESSSNAALKCTPVIR